MILCVTPNPAVDRSLVIPGFVPGHIYRPVSLLVAAGGKGINVARALHVLGGEPLCAGFLGGYSGKLLADLAEEEGLRGAWTWIDSETRTCTILADPEGEVTVVNENGPRVTADDWIRLQADVLRESGHARGVCFSGSLPPGSPPAAFAILIQTLRDAGRQVWVDTSGGALQTALAVPGVHIKVNVDEAGDALGQTIGDVADAAAAAQELRVRGSRSVVLTMGAQGAVLAHEAGCWWAQPPQLKVMSAVGSGDSFLGGLVLSATNGLPPDEALRRAVAAGAANALTVGGGQFSLDDYQRVLAATIAQAL